MPLSALGTERGIELVDESWLISMEIDNPNP